jgi:GntR family transcriptional regulator
MSTTAKKPAKYKILDRRLNKQSPVPLYHQLEEILLERIGNGSFKANDRLPAEHDLAAEFGVSKITVRQALSNLAAAGVIRRDQGRGTFVAEPKVEEGPRELTSFSQEMRRRGYRPTSIVLEREVIPAKAEIAEKLGLRVGDQVFRLKRLRLADGAAMGIQTAYIPADMVPDILREDLGSDSLYVILARKYGLVPSRAREVHHAVRLDPKDAKCLSVPEGSPALAAERVTFTEGGRAIELVHSVMRGDRYQMVLELVKSE